MSLFPVAFADTTSTTAATTFGGFNIMSFLPMIIIFGLFWMLLIRPQQKKMKLQNQMLSALETGDEVMLNSGVIGKIVKLSDKFIILEVTSGVNMTFQRSVVSAKLEKGTLATAIK